MGEKNYTSTIEWSMKIRFGFYEMIHKAWHFDWWIALVFYIYRQYIITILYVADSRSLSFYSMYLQINISRKWMKNKVCTFRIYKCTKCVQEHQFLIKNTISVCWRSPIVVAVWPSSCLHRHGQATGPLSTVMHHCTNAIY